MMELSSAQGSGLVPVNSTEPRMFPGVLHTSQRRLSLRLANPDGENAIESSTILPTMSSNGRRESMTDEALDS